MYCYFSKPAWDFVNDCIYTEVSCRKKTEIDLIEGSRPFLFLFIAESTKEIVTN